jgi:hypothetical protein
MVPSKTTSKTSGIRSAASVRCGEKHHTGDLVHGLLDFVFFESLVEHRVVGICGAPSQPGAVVFIGKGQRTISFRRQTRIALK